VRARHPLPLDELRGVLLERLGVQSSVWSVASSVAIWHVHMV
jgi:hypothetical protein